MVVLKVQVSSCVNVTVGVPEGSILGSLLFLIYFNDLSKDLPSNAKLFADDTFLFSVIHDSNTSRIEINGDLSLIKNWAFQWKTSVNRDASKQAQVIFRRKTKKVNHSPLIFNNLAL